MVEGGKRKEFTIPAAHEPQRTDQYGDLLPIGAISRIGTTRLRHTGTYGLAFCPNNETLASAGDENSICLWDLRTGKEIHRFRLDSAFCVAYSPDGRKLAGGGWNGEIIVWDVASKTELYRFSGHKAQVCSVAFSPRGNLLASASVDGTARVWDLSSGKELWRFQDHKGHVRSVAFSPDDKILATGGDDGTIRLWEMSTGKETRQFRIHSGQPLSLFFSADGKTVASSGVGNIPTGPGEINTWQVASGKNLSKVEEKDHWFSAVLSPDGKTVALQRARGKGVELVLAATGEKVAELNTGPSLVCAIVFSANGKLLATTGLGSAIRIWDIATAKPISEIGGHQSGITATVFAGKDKYLVTANWEGTKLWDPQTGKHVCSLGRGLKYDPTLAASCDGKVLAIGSDKVVLWDVAKRRLLRKLPAKMLASHCLAFSLDGRSMITPGGFERAVASWDVASGKKTSQFGVNDGVLDYMVFGCVAFSGRGNLLVAAGVAGSDCHLVGCRWDLDAGNGINHFEGQGGACLVTLSTDGQLLAYADEQDVIHIWDAAAGREKLRFTTLKMDASGIRKLYALAFSPDGRTLAAGCSDHSVRLWEAATGQERHRYLGHRDRIRQVAFSLDGKMMASVSDDTTALIWDVPGVSSDKSGLPDLPKLWVDLAATNDAGKAYRAIWTLTLMPEKSLPFLHEHVHAVASADPRVTARLIGELDSDKFAVREKAVQQLTELGEQAAADVRAALKQNLTLETHRRLEKVLKTLEAVPLSGDQLRLLRALEVLEMIGNDDCQTLLETLAKGTSEARLTKEAKATLDRLAKRFRER